MSRVLGWFLHPVYDLFDLRGPDGRPSLTKLTYVGTLIFGWAIWLRLAVGLTRDGWLGFLGFSFLIMTYAMGRPAFASLETAILALAAKWGAPGALQARTSQSVPRPPEPTP